VRLVTHASHIFVLPGGGYEFRADHEGEPVAEWLRGLGHTADVLDYPVAPHRYPEALDFVRGQIVKKRSSFAGSIGVLGFSAGGHLAGDVALAPSTHRPEVPDFAILCYPVTLMGEGAHVGSRENLLGLDSTTEQRASVSLPGLVTDAAPPMFLWHTAADAAVPPRHSLELAQALADHAVPVELHLFPFGAHGIGMADGPDIGGASQWRALAATWLETVPR
jgi:acetyl esterase/lipase